MENWKPLVECEGRYEVSDLGRIRTVASKVRRRQSYKNVA